MQCCHADVHDGKAEDVDVLICGAGAAGLSLAQLLGTQGRRVTVVEAAPAVRNGGLAIDVRGDALAIANRMGILATLQAAQVRMLMGTHFVDAAGRTVGVMTPELVASEFYEEGEHDVEVSRRSSTTRCSPPSTRCRSPCVSARRSTPSTRTPKACRPP